MKKIITLGLISMLALNNIFAQGYVVGDFHQHSTYTDGKWNIFEVFRKEAVHGLDWFANSEHGGDSEYYGAMSGNTTTGGKQVSTWVKWEDVKTPENTTAVTVTNNRAWRWQVIKYFSFNDVLQARKLHPDKLIVQGVEWNVPGHEHANVAIIGNQFTKEEEKRNADAVAEFEYRFDERDHDTTGGLTYGWSKSSKSGHSKTLEAIAWLQANHKDGAWVVPTHPERKNKYTISDLRDMNDAGPDVCFGFDIQPGHQKADTRGEFSDKSYGATPIGATFGGTGAMAATVGGLWDAMLSEGRHWWAFSNSDFHDTDNDFFPGEYQRTYTYVKKKGDPLSLVEGLHSGNSFVTVGLLIDSLSFSVNNAVMGETANIPKGSEVTVSVVVRGANLNHVDIIEGYVGKKLKKTDPGYTFDKAPRTKVVARYGKQAGIKDCNGLTTQEWTGNGNMKTFTFKIKATENMYFRLRGTNHALGADGETDCAGNPLPDPYGANNQEKAWADKWFYSNPVFVVDGK